MRAAFLRIDFLVQVRVQEDQLEHHPLGVAAVVHLVLKGVVEERDFALGPARTIWLPARKELLATILLCLEP